LTATHECVWSNEGPSRDARQQFRVGDLLELESGQAELEFADGAEVVLAGPARVRIDSAGSCTLELGEAMAELPARAGGFTVHTPTAAIVDLGTSFAVAVDAAGVTEVHVFKGQVAVQPAGDDDEGDAGQMRRLSAGAALQIDDSRMFREIDCEPARFVRRTPNVAHLSAHQGGGLLRSDGGVMLGGSNDGVRRIGASSEANVSLVSVLLFRLPKLDDPSDIDAARLVFAYKSKDGDPDFAVDLYGLGHVPAAAVEPAWFFEGSVDLSSRAGYKTGSAPRQVQRISADVIGPQTRPGRVIVQSPELAEFISSLFRDGAEAGDLAVFRLNATAPTQQIPRITGYNVVHAPAIVGKTQPYEVPTLTIFTGKQAAENFNP
jgi:hypothetical protein